jgi:hypothetical protein
MDGIGQSAGIHAGAEAKLIEGKGRVAFRP